MIDGEAVILGVDGISDFDALHSGKHNEEVQLGAFDILVEGGDDLRKLPLSAHDVMELTWPDDLTWPTSASTPVTHADVVPGPGNGKTRQRTQRAAFGGKFRS